MAENFRKGDRVDWQTTRMTAEPDKNKHPGREGTEHPGSDDDHEGSPERR